MEQMTFLEKVVKYIKDRNKEKQKVVATKPDEDFIPYVCHYDKNSVLTKNGELIQTIRITGLTDNNIALDLISLRDTVRDAIYENSEDDSFAFWFHTIRRRKSVVAESDHGFTDYLSKEINDKWVKENELESQFINEFYISIVHEGLLSPISDMKSLAKSFSYSSIQKEHTAHLENSCKKLSELTKKILLEVEDHGAKLLGIKDWEGILYSEPMRFFGKIINLYEDRYPLSINDMSSDLSSHKMAFGNREIEVSNKDNKNFSAILSIKEYHEVSVESLDKILTMPFEFIITQAFDVVYDKKELEPYQYNSRMLEISEDTAFKEVSGLDNFMKSYTGKDQDYGKVQTSVMVISQNIENLEKDVSVAVEKFSELGFVMVREDIFSEHCFWAQLPGNFAFLRRKKLINTLRVPGFAALNSFPSGSIQGNHWGPAITTLKTIIDTPYFFNFHDRDSGHSLIFGPKGSGKTTLTNFLLAQARKINNKIIYFDIKNSSKSFIKALGGKYYKLTKDIEDEEFLQMNPFSLPFSENNAGFLAYWIKQLVMFLKAEVSDEELQEAYHIISNVLQSKDPNFLVAFDALRTQKTKNIYDKLKIWGDGKLSYIFGSQNDINWSDQFIGINLDEIINQKPILIPVFSYLMHRIETELDGSPTIIVIDGSFEFLDNQVMREYLPDLLKYFRSKNCMVLFNAKDHRYISESQDLAKIIHQNVATEIYLPNEQPQDYYKDIFELKEDEFEVLRYMAQDGSSSRNALIKHSSDSLIIDSDLSIYEDLLSILSSDEIAITILDEIFASYKADNSNQDPSADLWIPQFLEIIKTIREDQKKQQIEKLLGDKKDGEEDEEENLENQEESYA